MAASYRGVVQLRAFLNGIEVGPAVSSSGTSSPRSSLVAISRRKAKTSKVLPRLDNPPSRLPKLGYSSLQSQDKCDALHLFLPNPLHLSGSKIVGANSLLTTREGQNGAMPYYLNIGFLPEISRVGQLLKIPTHILYHGKPISNQAYRVDNNRAWHLSHRLTVDIKSFPHVSGMRPGNSSNGR